MGRWITALKKHENAGDGHLQNPQNPISGGFEGFEGSPPEEMENFSLAASEGRATALGRALPPNDKIDLNDKNPPEGIKSISSILSEAGEPAAVPPMSPARSDAELYAETLKRHGPTSYGVVAVLRGWGMTRSANAETALRTAGHIRYDHAGRGRYIETPEGENHG